MGPEFFLTGMGRQFFEGTLPRLAASLERIATALEKAELVAETRVEPAPFVDKEAHLFRPDIQKVEDLCEECRACLVPGAIFPMASNGRMDAAYVERCDDCRLFMDDMAAALAIAARLGQEVVIIGNQPAVTGYTFKEAEKMNKVWKKQTPEASRLRDLEARGCSSR